MQYRMCLSQPFTYCLTFKLQTFKNAYTNQKTVYWTSKFWCL